MRRQNQDTSNFYLSLFAIHLVLTLFELYRAVTKPHEADCPEDIAKLTFLLTGVAALAGHKAATWRHAYFSRHESPGSTPTRLSLFVRAASGPACGALVQHVAAEAHRLIPEPTAKAIALLAFYGAALYSNSLSLLNVAAAMAPPQAAPDAAPQSGPTSSSSASIRRRR